MFSLYFLKLALLHLLVYSLSCTEAVCPEGWTASSTFPGSKCYFVRNMSAPYRYDRLASTCRDLEDGADVLSVGNAFENAELAAFLKSKGLKTAAIGYLTKTAQLGRWIAKTGNTSYVNPGGNFFTLIRAQDGQWTGGESASHVLCQLYPDDPLSAPDPLPDCPQGFFPALTMPGTCLQLHFTANFHDANATCAKIPAEIVTLTGGVFDALEVGVALNDKYDQSGMLAFHINYGQLGSSQSWHWMGSAPSNFTPTLPGTNPTGPCAYFEFGSFIYLTDDCLESTDAHSEGYIYTACGIIASRCPAGWRSSSVDSNKCWAAFEQETTFDRARIVCQNVHDEADLLAIDNDKELAALQKDAGITTTSIYWLGLQSSAGGNGWNWTTPAGPIDAWASGQPDTATHPTHLCAGLKSGAYYADDCASAHKLICQLRLSA